MVIPRDFLEYADKNETIVRFYYSEHYPEVELPELEPAQTIDPTDSSHTSPAHSSPSQQSQNSDLSSSPSSSSSSSSSDPSHNQANSPPRPTAQSSPAPLTRTSGPRSRVRLPSRPKRIRHRTPTPEPEIDPSTSNQTVNNPIRVTFLKPTTLWLQMRGRQPVTQLWLQVPALPVQDFRLMISKQCCLVLFLKPNLLYLS